MKNRVYNFNFDWKFCDHDCEGKNFDRFAAAKYDDPRWVKVGNNGLAVSNFDDSAWENIKLPHDFVIEKCDFTREESDSVGSLRKGVCWYRKTFNLPKEAEGNRVFIRFDGVFRDSQVWCNGHFVGRHLGGYMGFCYDITEVLNEDMDKPNTIAVFVDATGYEGWWYEGGGIYRDVSLIVAPNVCVAEKSVFVKPYDINFEDKKCHLSVQFEADSNLFEKKACTYRVDIMSPNGDVVKTLEGNTEAQPLAKTLVSMETTLEDVSLWDTENPHLYQAKIYLTSDDACDEVVQKFGVRHIAFNATEGLKLNGQSIYLKGVCGHDDLAGVGTALTRSTMKYKIDVLKSIGCNSYRCSHNPPSPLFLDLCDEMGFIVLDEHRLPGTSAECLEDYQNFIRRDRNHPSVFFYSMGNEEMGIQNNKFGVNIFSKMIALGEQIDDSREYLFAINCDIDEIITYLNENGYKRKLHGANYLKKRDGYLQHEDVHKHNPDCCFISTETSGMCSTRGYVNSTVDRPRVSDSARDCCIWNDKKFDGQMSCYGDCGPFWSLTAEEALKVHDDKPYFLGQYFWTGFDYRGETFPYEFPQVISTFGILDLCGFYKDWAYYVKAWWGNEPLLHIFPSWNLDLEEGADVSVWAFTNCDEVELFINNVSQGRKVVERLGHLEWDVQYNRGELKAIGYKDGEVMLTEVLRTSGAPHKLVLTTDKTELIADKNDSTIITVEVVDEAGNLVTDATIDIDFEISGGGTIIGTGNGDPASHEHDKKPCRKLYAGKALVIVESTFEAGEMILKASSKDVISAEVSLTSTAMDTMSDYIFGVESEIVGGIREKYIDL